MDKAGRMFKAVEGVAIPYRCDMTVVELQALYRHHNGDRFGIVRDAFKYGYLKGQRQEKARKRAKEGR